ncbi:hypothetical protein C7S20_03325 [Christiangramia fulva]|uniref:Uncharacterized protein n=1 Tax=Christiangramia fulva TaxID=2126553 RepID=A0A2R3Z280_9FLAO|nr:nitrous oxide reductase accessory protein NosL [Christiangramia fulva]AVR44364.1 hypothetical protein C7S20_03325 [Christiangramia fulva]
MKAYIYGIMLMVLTLSCQVEPHKINYGHEACSYCKMTIVDSKYASQLVASTGKAYNFDAIECMINFKKENPDKNFSLFLVSDYDNPGKLIDASGANYLISDEISSPMGANLAAFTTKQEAEKTKNLFGGTIYEWEDVTQEVRN